MKKQKHMVEERLTILHSIKDEDNLVEKQKIWKQNNKVQRTIARSQDKSDYMTNVGFAVKTGKDAVTALDGAVIASSTSATDLMVNLASTDIITFGGGSASQKLNGHIKSIKYYPRRLSNAQLQELTT